MKAFKKSPRENQVSISKKMGRKLYEREETQVMFSGRNP
jgi:hypothetical protein